MYINFKNGELDFTVNIFIQIFIISKALQIHILVVTVNDKVSHILRACRSNCQLTRHFQHQQLRITQKVSYPEIFEWSKLLA